MIFFWDRFLFAMKAICDVCDVCDDEFYTAIEKKKKIDKIVVRRNVEPLNLC